MIKSLLHNDGATQKAAVARAASRLRRRVTAVVLGGLIGLGLLAPVASRAAVPMQNGCRVAAPSKTSCRYVARGNGRWVSGTDSEWMITVMRGGRVRTVVARGNYKGFGRERPARTGTFRAAPGDIVAVEFESMISVGMVWVGDA